ncbi:RapZ C-terminal domain-containing protein [Sediminibacterium soli]|uniref:RapZ C-terminal domain-containing protein n=1 Tax=Sediminibacterium soli TaxID=2698829 RepID=UPI00137A29FD|nr:RNase adapter RapZ [Sediminibacterium soli]NCI45386.1 phosphotransferase [Sediminibacterium soli]
MESVIEAISALFARISPIKPDRIEKLPQSGSDRTYFRLYSGENTFIATYNLNRKETQTFVYFSRHFEKAGLPVPQILAVNEEDTIYLQQDLGTDSLLNKLEQHGHQAYAYGLFQKSLAALARLQVLGDSGLDYSWCLTAREFGKQAILSDLLYFKYYFLDTLQLPYDKQAMLDDFDALSTYLTRTEYKYFMMRDFQSRNIIVKDDEVSFIDYQGGMKGALQYDVASMLWQAKAELSEEWKDSLLEYYMDRVDELLGREIDRVTFVSQYNGYVLIRLMQVMGAYGFRGLFERKAHFLASIPLALRNLKFFIEHKRIGIVTPEFDRVLKLVVTDDMIRRFEPPQANEATPLMIEINSFSYKKGIPKDGSENGGGFVFDMRGILNPGRFDEYKTLSGKDKPVQDFLEQRTKMNEFLNSVWDLVDITVEEYLRRGFDHLMINFGCTGGQHRSVYAAEQTARHLRNKYKLKIKLDHTNTDNWVRTLPANDKPSA